MHDFYLKTFNSKQSQLHNDPTIMQVFKCQTPLPVAWKVTPEFCNLSHKITLRYLWQPLAWLLSSISKAKLWNETKVLIALFQFLTNWPQMCVHPWLKNKPYYSLKQACLLTNKVYTGYSTEKMDMQRSYRCKSIERKVPESHTHYLTFLWYDPLSNDNFLPMQETIHKINK